MESPTHFSHKAPEPWLSEVIATSRKPNIIITDHPLSQQVWLGTRVKPLSNLSTAFAESAAVATRSNQPWQEAADTRRGISSPPPARPTRASNVCLSSPTCVIRHESPSLSHLVCCLIDWTLTGWSVNNPLPVCISGAESRSSASLQQAKESVSELSTSLDFYPSDNEDGQWGGSAPTGRGKPASGNEQEFLQSVFSLLPSELLPNRLRVSYQPHSHRQFGFTGSSALLLPLQLPGSVALVTPPHPAPQKIVAL